MTTGTSDPVGDARRRRLLTGGPWCWSPCGTPGYARDAALAGGGPPALRAGEVLLLSVARDRGSSSLWKLAIDDDAAGGVAFTDQAAVAWRTALAALPRVVPVLWQPLYDLRRRTPRGVWLDTWTAPGRGPSGLELLDGPSFGLSFVLAIASWLFATPLRSDVAASATIDAEGRVGRVDGLEAKIRALGASAPSVSRLLVHASQQQEAAALGIDGITVVGVTRVAEAWAEAFDPPLTAESWQARVTSAADRHEFARSLFELALSDRSALVDWAPVARAASIAEGWPLEVDVRANVAFAHAVARRHEENRGSFAIPGPEWLARLPAERRYQVIAHLVEQAADTGVPSPEEARALAAPFLPPSFPHFDARGELLPTLRVAGAVARLLAVTGDAATALAIEADRTEAFLEVQALADVSFGLSAWLRLAGALRDDESWTRAAAARRRADVTGALTEDNRSFVDLAWARGAVALGRVTDEVLATLAALARGGDAHVPWHVRWSAARWGLAAQRDAAGFGAIDFAALLAAGVSEGQPDARLFWVLSELDEALAQGASGVARLPELLGALSTLEPALVDHLRRSASADDIVSHAHGIARFYPY